MRLTYDPDADAVYIYMSETDTPVSWTYPCDPARIKGMINLDFDATNRLVGVEIIDASRMLPRELLELVGTKSSISFEKQTRRLSKEH